MAKVTFTNKRNLPEPLVNAVKHDGHVMLGNISVTSLIDAPRIRVLKKLIEEREEDVSDRMWMLWGTSIHNILQKSDKTALQHESFLEVIKLLREKSSENSQFGSAAEWLAGIKNTIIDESKERYMVERTLTADIETQYGTWTLCGTIDLYDKETRTIQDYKLCTTYKWTSPESQRQWIRQLNVYAWLCEQNGLPVKRIQIIPMFRNWSASSMIYSKQKQKDYPDSQILVIDLPMSNPEWTEEERKERVKKWIVGMIEDHQRADIGEVRDCDGFERWASAGAYKIYKDDSSKATKVAESEAEAKEWIMQNSHKYKPGTKLEIKFVEGESRRCEQYCPVFAHCPQAQRHRMPRKTAFDRLVSENSDANMFDER